MHCQSCYIPLHPTYNNNNLCSNCWHNASTSQSAGNWLGSNGQSDYMTRYGMSPDFSTGDDQGQGPSQGPVQGQGQPGFMPSTQYYNYPVYNHQWPNAQTSSYSNGYARDPDPGPDDIISYPAATQDLALGYSPPPALASSASPTTAMTDLSRQFPCTMCPNSFKYRKDLNRHLDTVHKTLDDPVYRCRCGKTDTRKDNCRRHVRNCKGKHPDRYFICKCGSTFTVKEEYIAHFADCHFTRPGP